MPSVFAGEARRIEITLRNPDGSRLNADLRTRLYQTSSATAIPLGETPWKKLEVLPGQTVLESAAMTFPAVKAETRFAVHWLEGASNVVGTTEVLVYPPDLLKELKPLAGEEPLGVFDPQNQLKPLLKAVGADLEDLEDTGLGGYHGKLTIIGPFQSRGQASEGARERIKKMAERGVAVVWIQPPPKDREKLRPSFYAVAAKQTAVVVVQPELVADLPENPQAQLNLIYFCRRALNPQPLILPDFSAEP